MKRREENHKGTKNRKNRKNGKNGKNGKIRGNRIIAVIAALTVFTMLPIVSANGSVLSFALRAGGKGKDVRGQRSFDNCNAIAVDREGNTYIAGGTSSLKFPLKNQVQSSYGGGDADIFVMKLNADGSEIIYSTYLGGSGEDQALDIAVDAEDNLYITGFTNSKDFPTYNAIQPQLKGDSSAFVTKLNAAGNAIQYSTYLGGSGPDMGLSIAVDKEGRACVAGLARSKDFPTFNAIQPVMKDQALDLFITKLNGTGDSFIFSTYLGGSGGEAGTIALDAEENIYLAGATGSKDFPITPGAFQTSFQGSSSGFIMKLSAEADRIIYSTFFADNGIRPVTWAITTIRDLAVDQNGNVCFTGYTNSPGLPLKNPLQSELAGAWSNVGSDAFIAKLNSTGSDLIYSTYLGGTVNDEAFSIAVDSRGCAYITGSTASEDFPTAVAVQPRFGGNPTPSSNGDAFITKLSESGNQILYSTFYGGKGVERATAIAVDHLDNAYIAGGTSSKDFPVSTNALQNKNSSNFIIKLVEPRINSAKIEKGRLYVKGSNLNNDMVIMVDGVAYKTLSDTSSRDTLVSKKAAKAITAGITVTLQVRATNGTLSEPFLFVPETTIN